MAAAISTAMDEVITAGYIPSGVVLNPADWSAMARTDLTADAYLFGYPGLPGIWGLPVVQTPAMPKGQFVVGDFLEGCQLFDREAASVLYATQNQDDFIRNLLTARAEERLAFLVYQPQCFRKAGP
jgi:HK97 family phage major capsid protein